MHLKHDELYILTVVDDPSDLSDVPVPHLAASYENQGKQVLCKYYHLCNSIGIKATMMLGRSPDISQMICSAVQTKGIDWLFLGFHSDGFFKKLMKTSVWKHCVENSSCNVTVVKSSAASIDHHHESIAAMLKEEEQINHGKLVDSQIAVETLLVHHK